MYTYIVKVMYKKLFIFLTASIFIFTSFVCCCLAKPADRSVLSPLTNHSCCAHPDSLTAKSTVHSDTSHPACPFHQLKAGNTCECHQHIGFFLEKFSDTYRLVSSGSGCKLVNLLYTTGTNNLTPHPRFSIAFKESQTVVQGFSASYLQNIPLRI